MKNASKNNQAFFKGKRVLVTGHTGFKGAWITNILSYIGAEALGYALPPEKNSLYEKIRGDELIKSVYGNLTDIKSLKYIVKDFQPEIVLHLAAFGFVKECFADPMRAYRDNVLGTLCLLESLRECSSIRSIVLISTDKVYDNQGDGALYAEEDILGGIGPYAASKTCMEILANDYRETYFLPKRTVGIATVRASNVLGGGDHIESRLIPSILRAVDKGIPVEIRHPEQTRPWQSVLDALNGYLAISRLLYEEPRKYSEAWNVGPMQDGIRTVGWIVERIKKSFRRIETWQAAENVVQEATTLGLNINKSLNRLDWKPLLTLEQTIDQVVEFFRCQQDGQWERDLCYKQIHEFYGRSE